MPHRSVHERTKPAAMAAHRHTRPPSPPSVVVKRYAAGDVGEPLHVPAGVHALRFPFGKCRFVVGGEGGWASRGEAAAGFVQVTAAKAERSEWLSAGEEVILLVPVEAWGTRITQRMRNLVKTGAPRRHGDAVLQQLIQVLAQATNDQADNAFIASLVDAILIRSVIASNEAPVPGQRGRAPCALPAHRLARVRDYVQRHLGGPVTLSDMARAVGLSDMHFASQFRAATGKRPHDYLIEQRIERAQRLMDDTTRSLCDVALSAGFSTQAHFSTVFKKVAGVTPGHWRAAAQVRHA